MSKNSKLLIVKVGSDERPAGEKDLKLMKKILKKMKCLKKYDKIITHHAVDFDFLRIP